jgi:hypothetical protein
MKPLRLLARLSVGVPSLVLAVQVRAGRFEEFTKKASAGQGLKTLAATYFGGPGVEEFVACGGQADGTVIAFGNAWGPAFPAAPAPLVVGKGKRYDVPDSTTDSKGRAVFDRANPNVAGTIVRYSADLQRIVGVTRFDWGVASIETGLVAPDGLLIAGRCAEGFVSAIRGAPVVRTALPADDQPAADAAATGTSKKKSKPKEPKFGPTTYQGAPVTGDVYVAKMTPDASRFVWVHLLQGLRTPAARLFADKGGAIVVDCNGVKRISADGRTLTAVTPNMSEGDRVKVLAVNPADGTILHGGDRNTHTNKEPWRQPFLNLFDAAGQRLWRIWDWDPKSVGADAKKLQSDSACRAGAFAPNGDIVVGGWSDGGNSVFTRTIKDVDTPLAKGTPGYGMSCWGMKGANSLGYLMRFDPKTFQVKAWTLWVSYVPQNPSDPKSGGNPNFANLKRIEMLPDGSVFWFGQAATGLIQTPQAWFQYTEGGKSGGYYVAVFSGDFTNLVFSSYVPACEVQGLGQTKTALLVAGRSAGKDDNGNASPVANAVQKTFGGAQDGHVILLELPKGQ